MTKQITQRVALDGGAEFRAGLKALGQAGQEAFKNVKDGIDNAGKSAAAMAPALAALQTRFKDIKEAGGEFKSRFAEMTNLVGDFGRKLAEIAALAVPLTGGGLVEAIIGGGKAASEIEKVANGLGITTKTFQEMAFAAGQADVAQDDFARGLGRLENKASEAQKAQVEYQKEYQKVNQNSSLTAAQRQKEIDALNLKMRESTDVFTRLGIAVTNQDGSFRGVDEILHRLLEEWPQLTKAQQASFASQLGFSRDRSMLNVLALGAKGFDNLVQESRRVAPALTETQLAVGVKLNESVNKLTASWTSMYNAARLAFAPFASAFAESLTERISAIRQNVINFAQYLAGQLRPILTDIIKLMAGEEIDPTGFIGQVRSAWIEAKATFIEVFGILKSGWNAVVFVMDYVAAAINAVFGTNFSGKALAVIVLLGSISGAFSAISTVIGVIIAGVALFASAFGVAFGGIEAVIAVVGYLLGYYFGDRLKADLTAIPEVFATVIAALKDGWNGTIENFKTVFTAGFEALKSYFAGWVDWILKAVQPVIDVINRITGAGGSASGAGAAQGLTGGYAGGGAVQGAGTGTSDSIVARLSNGEYVVRAAAVSHYGASFLNAINSMRLPPMGFSLGGLVDALSPRVPRYATGGMVNATPSNGHPVILQIGDSKFGPMMAGEATVNKLSRFATGQQMRSGGRKPSWRGK
jgi:hypothetical protein